MAYSPNTLVINTAAQAVPITGTLTGITNPVTVATPTPVNVKLYDEESSAYMGLSLDQISKYLIGIDTGHHKVHEGDAFSLCDTVACDTTTVKWMIATPATTRYAHLLFELSCTGEATYLVTGDSDRNAGTALTVVNRRRVGSPAAATTTVSRTPTGGTTDGATILFSKRSGITGAGSKSVESSFGRDVNEWVLKPNTKYVVSITTYAAVYATCQLDWYELTE